MNVPVLWRILSIGAAAGLLPWLSACGDNVVRFGEGVSPPLASSEPPSADALPAAPLETYAEAPPGTAEWSGEEVLEIETPPPLVDAHPPTAAHDNTSPPTTSPLTAAPSDQLPDQINTDNPPPIDPPRVLVLGKFEIRGISGADQLVGPNLVGERKATIYWTRSENAQEYETSIANAMTGEVICPPEKTTALAHAFSNCALPDGNYRANATAIGLGTTLPAASSPFLVDATGPSVMIQPAVVVARNSTIAFSVTPSTVPVNAVICQLAGGPTAVGFTPIVDTACLGLTVKQFTSLPFGDYVFSVQATDQLGLTTRADGKFAVTAPPCTPLVNYTPECDRRLKATLYFHPSPDGMPRFQSVNDYINPLYKVDTPLFFTDLWIPTRSFSTGFPTISNRTEFFALDIRTKLQTSATMPAGPYQLGILSDDGSIVSVIDAAGQETEIHKQDSETSTRLGCAQTPVNLVASQKINLRVRYFQGPRFAIALVLLYRPLANADMTLPIACGRASSNFFGTFPVALRDPKDRDYPDTMYAQLLTQGWLPVPAASFSNPDLP